LDLRIVVSHDTAFRNMFLHSELMRVLRAARVSVIVLKGVAMADAIYSSIASHPMNDIDLLTGMSTRNLS
jgi:hypothetical protein